METHCGQRLTRADWSLLYPYPIGVPPLRNGCVNGPHVAVNLEAARVRLMLRGKYPAKVSVSTQSYLADIELERLVRILTGQLTRASDLPLTWGTAFGAPDCDPVRDSKLVNSYALDPLLFYFAGSVHEWGENVGRSQGAAWRARLRWVAAALIIADIQWVFRFPCVCNAIIWWGMNRRTSLRKPLPTDFLGYGNGSAVSAIIHLDDLGLIDEDAVLTRVLEDPAAYVRYYLRRGDETCESEGPSFTATWTARDPAVDIWEASRQRMRSQGCRRFQYPPIRNWVYDFTSWQKPANSRLDKPSPGKPLSFDWRVALATGYEPPTNFRAEMGRLALV